MKVNSGFLIFTFKLLWFSIKIWFGNFGSAALVLISEILVNLVLLKLLSTYKSKNYFYLFHFSLSWPENYLYVFIGSISKWLQLARIYGPRVTSSAEATGTQGSCIFFLALNDTVKFIWGLWASIFKLNWKNNYKVPTNPYLQHCT